MESAPPFTTSLIAGGAAGLTVDLSLYPLDTLKTRLQSEQGFWKSGGFKNVYRGLLPVAVGSVPGAAIFFCTYNTSKNKLSNIIKDDFKSMVHLLSASAGEVAACSVRVPIEIFKQRLQATETKKSALQLAVKVWQNEGIRGFYRGLGSTILREVPFSCVQFPLWEELKMVLQNRSGKPIAPWEGALCGAVAGGISAAITTPLDVAKTRIMLHSQSPKGQGASILKAPNVKETLNNIYQREGFQGLFAGLTARVTWITIGGLVFFGVYEYTVDALESKV